MLSRDSGEMSVTGRDCVLLSIDVASRTPILKAYYAQHRPQRKELFAKLLSASSVGIITAVLN
ncbi:hypothetical protein [Nostoc sp. UIC 10607]|uniref:hypothetical protein n=1 Tax=Nostoc sp. UIC 10607 TaxID=3045935 RepID=UPI0039A08888